MSELERVRALVEVAIDDAMLAYKINKGHGAPADALGYDAGRIDGLKQALEILNATY
jgi:hypothetical protein